MKTLPYNFLKTLQEETKIKSPNLCRYFKGAVTPKLKRAVVLSKALEKQGVIIPAGDFYLKKDQIKAKIITQLKQALSTPEEAA